MRPVISQTFSGVHGDQRREVIQPSWRGGHAVLDELAGDAEEQEQLRAGLMGSQRSAPAAVLFCTGPA